jgi:hypothetical protein
MANEFQTCLYAEVKRLFPEGAVEVLVARPESFPPVDNPAVRLIHTASGIAVDCDEFPSQQQNYIAAAIRLRVACDEKNV